MGKGMFEGIGKCTSILKKWCFTCEIENQRNRLTKYVFLFFSTGRVGIKRSHKSFNFRLKVIIVLMDKESCTCQLGDFIILGSKIVMNIFPQAYAGFTLNETYGEHLACVTCLPLWSDFPRPNSSKATTSTFNPRKKTNMSPPQGTISKGHFIFRPSRFRGHVNFQGVKQGKI